MEAENPIEYREIVKGNPDFAGWISSAGTSIDYPVMQMSWEPEYYLHRNFAGEDSFAGVPFMGSGDMKEGDIFLYGHNMKNGTMFADLLKYQKEGAVHCGMIEFAKNDHNKGRCFLCIIVYYILSKMTSRKLKIS